MPLNNTKINTRNKKLNTQNKTYLHKKAEKVCPLKEKYCPLDCSNARDKLSCKANKDAGMYVYVICLVQVYFNTINTSLAVTYSVLFSLSIYF